MSPQLRIQLQAGVQHLHALGARATFELLVEMAEPVGEIGLLLHKLDQYRQITPELLRAVGGDQFPRRFLLVPADRKSA